ncbi:hypothetical protein [Reichenbachiella sp.]|uniref:hypothetical protein n=1 Tax=Reichenbachiella sp. TaxID=2184521 RepID=UPI003BAF0F4E
MKESLRVKFPSLILRLSNIEIKPIQLGLGQVAHRFLQRMAVLLPAEVIMTFICIELIVSSLSFHAPWLPYAGITLVLLLRMFSNSFQSDERPFHIGGFMMIISVAAYAIWNLAIAVFFFLCSLLLMTL